MRSIQLVLIFALISLGATAQNTPVTKANYQLAARFSPKKLEKLIFTTSVDPHWLKTVSYTHLTLPTILRV